jgi:putative holliday junction resolvase
VRTLALDIGTRRTGCAYHDEDIGVPLPLDTLSHTTVEEFAAQVDSLVRSRGIGRLVVGLPLLPSGQEGHQSDIVRSYVSTLQQLGLETSFLDERYTTTHRKAADGDALAALSILETYLDKIDS